MTPIERAAHAVELATGDCCPNCEQQHSWDANDVARAVLQAIMEPSEGMPVIVNPDLLADIMAGCVSKESAAAITKDGLILIGRGMTDFSKGVPIPPVEAEIKSELHSEIAQLPKRWEFFGAIIAGIITEHKGESGRGISG